MCVLASSFDLGPDRLFLLVAFVVVARAAKELSELRAQLGARGNGMQACICV